MSSRTSKARGEFGSVAHIKVCLMEQDLNHKLDSVANVREKPRSKDEHA
jgi:hypothetical protein